MHFYNSRVSFFVLGREQVLMVSKIPLLECGNCKGRRYARSRSTEVSRHRLFDIEYMNFFLSAVFIGQTAFKSTGDVALTSVLPAPGSPWKKADKVLDVKTAVLC